ncbi:glycosyltransferase family 2 protein [Prosthecochloris sp. HL-130-GSB]|jgi:poly-beta-1,6-N-acetyl-D-glucosamine synthase|uniref:glycosyltransferase family 2 protein n=1 Tax=Prosthecochloris sp. HL-130-GSB TaxID=1974213 RepID=UPI000A1C167C|nr:glycosyltransferase family 2 protein [Prosthecochloris sp. HL-130-GSB]ARM31235.1 glycosyl transferase [Prosthecochloris sp. HL-130-GSB]
MTIAYFLFWACLGLIIYTYIGYGMLVWLLLKAGVGTASRTDRQGFEPDVTLLIAAYNEKEWIAEKVANCRELDYPENKLRIMFVTDGSTDGTPDILRSYPGITVLHEPQRGGKTAALNRAMDFIETPLVIFTDANTMLNSDAVRNMVRHYNDPSVGCVAGEKRIRQSEKDAASGAGEGMYWKYESFLKKNDSRLWSAVGAAGELFSIRTELFEKLESDTLLDDFMISLRIAARGYRVIYEPDAYAIEAPSAGLQEEMKRKIRICAGGIQSVIRLRQLLNPFRHPLLWFEYVSHRVLRWTLTPLALAGLLVVNILLVNEHLFFQLFLGAQLMFYLMALAGWIVEQRKIRFKLLFIPLYFSMMNIAVFIGCYRYMTGRQSAMWEKARRAGN